MVCTPGMREGGRCMRIMYHNADGTYRTVECEHQKTENHLNRLGRLERFLGECSVMLREQGGAFLLLLLFLIRLFSGACPFCNMFCAAGVRSQEGGRCLCKKQI